MSSTCSAGRRGKARLWSVSTSIRRVTVRKVPQARVGLRTMKPEPPANLYIPATPLGRGPEVMTQTRWPYLSRFQSVLRLSRRSSRMLILCLRAMRDRLSRLRTL